MTSEARFVTTRDETRGAASWRATEPSQGPGERPSSSAPSRTPPVATTASTDDLGRRVIGRLSESLGAERVSRLLGSGATLRLQDDALEVSVPDRFTAEMVERRLGEEIRRAVRTVEPETELGVRVRVEQRPDAPTAGAPSSPSADTARAPASGAPAGVQTRRKIPEFVVGSSNRIAFEAVRRAACEPDGPALVFVHGPCGVGKTHLLRLGASACRRHRPDARVRFTTGESFVAGFVNAVRTSTVDAFQKKHRRLDLLVIDDVHVVAGKDGTQQELVRTLNDLQLTGARVVLASDAHPRDIARLQEALASRFVSGVVAPVHRPDADMVRRLVPALAKRRGLVLDPKGHEMLVHRVLEDGAATVRDIEGTLTQIQAMANLMDRDRGLFLSAEHVRQAVEMRAGARPGIRSGPVGIDRIIDAVCTELGVTRPDLASKGRAKKVVLAREVIVHLGKRHTARSYPELAMALERPNHSTVITAHQRFQKRLADGDPIRVGARVDGCSPGELVGRIERAMGVTP